jgi:kinesin family protein 4/21/27
LLNLKKLQELNTNDAASASPPDSPTTETSSNGLDSNNNNNNNNNSLLINNPDDEDTGGLIYTLADDENCQLIEKDLNELIVKIDIKKRLINELELNNKNLEQMRVHYQEKMSILHDRIKQVEEERDKVILNMTKINQDNKLDEQIRKIKQDYEAKLRTLQADLVKYEQLKAKNAQMLKHAVEAEKQLGQFRKEIVDMKKLKVKLMNQLRDEVSKSKQEEQRYMKQIALLKRDHLKKDNQIKNLEAEKKCRETVLKRKQEQIQALRKSHTGKVMSDKASGRVMTATATATLMSTSINISSSSSGNVIVPGAVNMSSSLCAESEFRMTSSRVAAASSRAASSGKETSTVNRRKILFQQKWTKIDQSVSGIFFRLSESLRIIFK